MLLFFEGKGETKIDSQTYFILNVLNCALFGKLEWECIGVNPANNKCYSSNI